MLLRISLARIPLMYSVRPVHAVLSHTRLMSTETHGSSTPLSKHIEQFVPIAIIFTFIGVIASTAAYYNGELVSLKKEIEGATSKLEERMAGVIKEVDAKVSGAKETITKEVDAKNAGSERTIDAKIAGFEKAADLKYKK
jgi:hypothetical protein